MFIMQKPDDLPKPLVAIAGARQPAPSFSRQSQPVSFKPWIITGIAGILLVIGTLGSWGFVAPITSAIIALGQVTVDTNRKQVAHLEGGVVDQLLVRDGSQVEAGQTLIKLDATRARARIEILRAGIDQNLAQLTRLKAELSGASTVDYPDELLARKETPSVQELLEGQTMTFEARRLTNQGQVDILERRVEQLQQEVIGLEAQLDSEKRRKVIIDQEVKSLDSLFKNGHVSQQRMLALHREAVQMEGNIGAIEANIARSMQSIGETKLQIIQGEKEFRQEVLNDIGTARSALADLREQYSAAFDVLQRIEIIAPVSGTVVGLTTHSVGAVVRPSDTILEIVPDQDALLIEVQIQPQDVDNVGLDQESHIRFTAFKQRTTPLLIGQVSYVSPDIVQDPKTGLAHYVARISVEKNELERLGEARLYPGMPAEVMITTGSRTAIQYLVQPIVESMNRAWREN